VADVCAIRAASAELLFRARVATVELRGVPNDTHTGAERRVIAGLRRLGPESRLIQTMALCRAADELSHAGIRLREGPTSEHALRIQLAKLRYGASLVARVEAHRAKVHR